MITSAGSGPANSAMKSNSLALADALEQPRG